MKREDMNLRVLVVNADDLGFLADMNAAIEAGHRMGRITNASLMVDGAAIDEAIEIAGRNPGRASASTWTCAPSSACTIVLMRR